jgi:hypothetical protein
MTKLTFYKNDTERVGRRDPETGAKLSVPNLDAFGNFIQNHTNLTVQHFGKQGEYFVLFPPASQVAGLECELLDGALPSANVPTEPKAKHVKASESGQA